MSKRKDTEKSPEGASRTDIKRRLKHTRQLNILRTSVFLAIAAAVLTVIVYAFSTALAKGEFDIKTIDVSGEAYLSKEEIIKISGIEEGDNIFLLNLNDVRTRINQKVMTARLIVEKKLPSTIKIEIEEVPILYMVAEKGNYYYVSGENLLASESKDLSKHSVPLLSGLKSFSFGKVGSPVNADPAYKLDNMIGILKTVQNNELLSEISEVSLTPQNTYRIITKQNSEFIVKDFTNFREYFAYIKVKLEEKTANTSINMTVGNYPIEKKRST